ncbi:anthranilate phosphoribosyltransferase [Marinitenerispora sediminis]|uniref:Anthranilate phosphoribosyltransferase n=1 Tax=Marinitenerispora sediminis TaxID=1931232 RepID=A0A368T6Y0_9ACTN|nr:anthranilate phosphoribosyltransferase [Marinitenerispora sediminis]RCV54152.1 anthranilate phosphoribosyltransferase [Marinitenerispora sediminis]RCV56795.1 anthranilate phosphoribosyltransferase [Marinitenerispora sediminis]RCV59642.1 anthranilate phosphoribosyltransferase [Marinitenerispora sediminis]
MNSPERTWPSLVGSLLAGRSLTADDTQWAMNEIMSGSATDVQVAGFAVAMRAKGETAEEVAGLARGMLDNAVRVSVPGPTLDIVGTGGDQAHTVNVSTMAVLAAAAAGARVVKHGNRAASSSCGTADVLERLGVVIDLAPEHTARMVEEAGVAFCFAPLFHPSYRHTARARRELAVPTVFNFLGPLTNPARPSAAAVGVFDPRMCEVVAGVFAERGDTALVFRGDDGLDELTTTTTSTVWVVRDGGVRRERLDPAALGIGRAAPDALRGGDVEFNAGVVRDFVAGRPGPVRDAVLLNAAAALAAADGVTGTLEDALAAGYARAAAAVDSGGAAAVLQRWIETSQALAKQS